jgi:predicted DNA-binding protein
MRRVNWTITERQHQELKRLSQATGLAISELVRRAIDKYIGLLGEDAAAAPEATDKTVGLKGTDREKKKERV